MRASVRVCVEGRFDSLAVVKATYLGDRNSEIKLKSDGPLNWAVLSGLSNVNEGRNIILLAEVRPEC